MFSLFLFVLILFGLVRHKGGFIVISIVSGLVHSYRGHWCLLKT